MEGLMNSYDKAHELARALQSSSEYQQFLIVKKAKGTHKKPINIREIHFTFRS